MKELDELIGTLEILQEAVAAKDKNKSFEAVTVLLLQFMQTFGHDMNLCAKTFPLLEELKNNIQAESYDLAMARVLAFLAKFRAVRNNLPTT